MANNFQWYDIVSSKDDIQQGDFIEECPIIIPPKAILEPVDLNVEVEVRNVILMTQSCDILKPKIKELLVCPYFTMEQLSSKETSYHDVTKRELLRRGYVVNRHLLDKCELDGNETDYLIVDFSTLYSVNKNVIKELITVKKNRKRLLPPYREHLSQAFARYFMRVGLPNDIPTFDPKFMDHMSE